MLVCHLSRHDFSEFVLYQQQFEWDVADPIWTERCIYVAVRCQVNAIGKFYYLV